VETFRTLELISSSYKAEGISVCINADNAGIEGRYDSELFLELLSTEFYSVLWAVYENMKILNSLKPEEMREG
jgi:hypothetical protein